MFVFVGGEGRSDVIWVGDEDQGTESLDQSSSIRPPRMAFVVVPSSPSSFSASGEVYASCFFSISDNFMLHASEFQNQKSHFLERSRI